MIIETEQKSIGLTPKVRNRVMKQIEAEVNFDDRPVWRLQTVYTSFFPWDDNPIDPEQIKRIRQLHDPRFVPIFRRMVYLGPENSIKTFEHYGFAWHSKYVEPDPKLAGTWRPVYGFFSKFPGGLRPTRVKWFEESRERLTPGSPRYKYGLPMWFTPWGSWVEDYAEEHRKDLAADEVKQRAHNSERKQEADANLAAEQAEADYKSREEDAWRKRNHCDFVDLNAQDEKEQLERQRNPGAFHPAADEKAGQLIEKTPFVQVEGAA